MVRLWPAAEGRSPRPAERPAGVHHRWRTGCGSRPATCSPSQPEALARRASPDATSEAPGVRARPAPVGRAGGGHRALAIVAAIYDNVARQPVAFEAAEGGWAGDKLPVAPNSSVGIATASDVDDSSTIRRRLPRSDQRSGRPTPPRARQADVKDLPATLRRLGRRRSSSSRRRPADGTKIPYFVVHPKGMKLDGINPTILYAYGGFQVSMHAVLFRHHRQAVAGARRGLGAGQYPRRRRVRAGVARGRPEDPPPADL